MKKQIECDKCKYKWKTKSKMFLVSCPKCGSKVRIIKKSIELKGGKRE